MFAGEDAWDAAAGDLAAQSRQLPGECLNALPLAVQIRHLAVFSFRAPWCPVSLARLKTFHEKLLPVRPDFVCIALTLGSPNELQELSDLLPRGTCLYYDRDLRVADALGLYAGRGMLKPGVLVANRLGLVEWTLMREARSGDWRAFAEAYLTAA